MELTGKVALVTGSAMGIGRSFALALAKEGADIVVVDRAIEEAKKVGREIEALGRQALVVQVDVSNSREVEAVVDAALKRFGKIDVLFNVAGIIERTLVVDTTEDSWDRVMDINLKGTFLFSKAVVKHMLERGRGKIINVSSGLGQRPDVTGASYGASKAGVIAFSQALSLEVGPLGINVNVFFPGITDTPMYRKVHPTDEEAAEYGKRQTVGRPYKPEEYEGMAVFLASDASNYMHGKVI